MHPPQRHSEPIVNLRDRAAMAIIFAGSNDPMV